MTSTILIARLFEHIEPINRGDRYEDPLDAVLHEHGLEVTGGGSQLSQTGEIEYADVEIQVADADAALPAIIGCLESAGAPMGSELTDESGTVLKTFGGRESLAVYLDGATLPDEVYAALDCDAVVQQLTDAAGLDSYHGCWQGPEETGLFFFGADAEGMSARVEPVLRGLPIGQNARVVVRPGKGLTGARTIRLPRE